MNAGHGLFAVKDVQLIPLPHGHTRASGREQQAERRYRKLITSGLDLSKDFLVSYSYNLCHTLQTNLTKPLSDPFDSRFVWNEYLTRDFRPKVRLAALHVCHQPRTRALDEALVGLHSHGAAMAPSLPLPGMLLTPRQCTRHHIGSTSDNCRHGTLWLHSN